MYNRSLTFVVLVALVAAAGAARAEEPRGQRPYALPPQAADVIQRMAVPYALDQEVASGWSWSGLSIRRYEATLTLEGPGGSAAIELRHPEDGEPAGERVEGPGVCLVLPPAGTPGYAAARALAERLRASAAEGAAGRLWEAVYAGADAPDEPLFPDVAVMRVLQALWALLFAFLGWELLAAWRSADSARRRSWLRESAALLGLFASALVLRYTLATWGPGDLRANLDTVFLGDGLDHRYGSAPNALLRVLFQVLPVDHLTVVGTNLVLGAFAPALLVLLVRSLGLGGGPAWTAGLLLAVNPILVRQAGEANRQAFAVFLALLALLALARYLRGGRLRLLLVAALAALLCQQSRPEALLLVPVLGLLALLLPPRTEILRLRPPSRTLAALAVCVALAATWWLLRDAAVSVMKGNAVGHWDLSLIYLTPQRCPWLDTDFTSLVVIELLVAGLLVGLLDRSRVVLWALLSLLGVAFITAANPTADLQILNARYHTLSLLPATLLSAAGLWGLADRAGRIWGPKARAGTVALLLAAVAVTTVAPMAKVTLPRTVDLEYTFLREQGAKLPDGALVYVVEVTDDLGLKQMRHRAPRLLGERQEWRDWNGETPPADRPTFYYHAASCYGTLLAQDKRARCEDAHARFRHGALFESRLPNRPLGPERFDRDPLLVGFYAAGGR